MFRTLFFFFLHWSKIAYDHIQTDQEWKLTILSQSPDWHSLDAYFLLTLITHCMNVDSECPLPSPDYLWLDPWLFLLLDLEFSWFNSDTSSESSDYPSPSPVDITRLFSVSTCSRLLVMIVCDQSLSIWHYIPSVHSVSVSSYFHWTKLVHY